MASHDGSIDGQCDIDIVKILYRTTGVSNSSRTEKLGKSLRAESEPCEGTPFERSGFYSLYQDIDGSVNRNPCSVVGHV